VTDGEISGREILVRLLDRTPLPTPGADAEQLLAAFEAIAAERAAVIAEIAATAALADADQPLLVELRRRDAVWLEALATAQRTIGSQRCGAGQLRAYAQTF
jgi:hypothetical protein